MRIFCETIFSDVLPALRSIVTKELIETYGLNQTEVAKKLGITQPAVSQYKSGLRGRRVNLLMSNKPVMDWIKKLAAEVAAGNVNLPEKICEICQASRKEKLFSDKDFLCLVELSKKEH